jgi:hypothetical protein
MSSRTISLLRRLQEELFRRKSSVATQTFRCQSTRVHSTLDEDITPSIRVKNEKWFSSEASVQDQRQRAILDPYERALQELPDGAQIHLDFFGEPVTFMGVSQQQPQGDGAITKAVASLDGFVIGVATKGKSFTGGGEEEGIFVQGAHSAALAWSELLRHASLWNSRRGRSAPMLAYVAVAPMLVQTGVGYVSYVDHLLSKVDSGVEGLPPIQLLPLAMEAASRKDDDHLNPREQAHLQVLDCLLRHDHRRALVILLRHLEKCPGDGLGLSLALDLAHTVGDSAAALRAAGSVAAYWSERRGGILRPSIPGYNTASALIAVGLAVGGRRSEAEPLATFAMDKGEKLAGGVATWAMAHILDAEGRTAEGISTCANSDGTRNFEACGLLYFDSILAGYGVRFALDREERGRGRSTALRLYDNNYERVLDYTGFATGTAWEVPSRKAPLGWRKSQFKKIEDPKNFMTDLFTPKVEPANDGNLSSEDGNDQIVMRGDALPSLHRDGWVPAVEDVLTWMPPTPQLLSDATLLLLRLTLNGTVSTQNYRWENLRNSWAAMLGVHHRYGTDFKTFEFYPMVCVAGSLLASPDQVGELSGAGGRLARALQKMGDLLHLGDIGTTTSEADDEAENSSFLSTYIFKDIVADKEPEFWLPVVDDESKKEEWRSVFKLLASAIDGVYDPNEHDDNFDLLRSEIQRGFEDSWEFDVRPLLEHALVYAACKCGDFETLALARSICSRGVTLRPSSPEEWWRYSIVLGLLGDEVASENALQASLALGGGQGARRDD